MLSSAPSVFDTLPARPPTPPRDLDAGVEKALRFDQNENETEIALVHSESKELSTETPPQSSPIRSPSGRTNPDASKKVGFLLQPTYHHSSQSEDPRSPGLGPHSTNTKLYLKDLKPLKSILKLSQIATPPTPEESERELSYFTPDDPGSFTKMLPSIMRQMRSDSLSSRLDAYLALNGALKSYEGVPDHQAMSEVLDSLIHYIRRDIACKSSDGALENNIATQALKLTAVLLFDSKLSMSIDDDFRTFLLDRSTTVMEQANLPKQIIKGHMFLIAQQRFHARIATPSRADRIISALNTIEDRCSGNSLIATRLVIYQRLIEQTPAVMLVRIADWLDHVFHGMMSNLKENKIRAIEVCTQAGLLYGTSAGAATAMHNLFESTVEEGACYYDYFSARLTAMIKEENMGIYVPQIWTAIILFFRSKRRQLQLWPRLKSWLGIIQKCLNTGDLETKDQAHLAWRRFVFSVMPGSSTNSVMLGMLKVPVQKALEKVGQDRSSKQIRQFGLDGYCNLLHYALRPGISQAEMDMAWGLYVKAILVPMAKASSKGRIRACRILTGLLSDDKGIWNENAALEIQPIMPEDLPRLEPRWIRSRAAKVLAVIEPFMIAAIWLPEEGHSVVIAIWTEFLQSIKYAGLQEVRASAELKEATAAVLNTLQRLWMACDQAPAGADPELATERFSAALRITFGQLEVSHLTSEFLTITSQDEVQAALTPSHRCSKHQVTLRSPLVFVIRLLCQSTTTNTLSPTILQTIKDLLRLAYEAKTHLAAQLHFLARTLQALHGTSQLQVPSTISTALRIAIAELTNECLTLETSPKPAESTHTIGQQLSDGVSILTRSLLNDPIDAEVEDVAKALTSNLLRVARHEAGDGGGALAVTEPLAKAACQSEASAGLLMKATILVALLDSAGWPQSKSALDHSRKVLHGNPGFTSQKYASYDPYEHFYLMTGEVLNCLYQKFTVETLPLAREIIRGAVAFLGRCPSVLYSRALQNVQSGIILWIEDPQGKIFGHTQDSRDALKTTWGTLLHQTTKLPIKDLSCLSQMENLLCAGFCCPSREIVSQTIIFWNDTFGVATELEYPARLASVLHAISDHAELLVPSIPPRDMDKAPIRLPAFEISEKDAGDDLQLSSSEDVVSNPTPLSTRIPKRSMRKQNAAPTATASALKNLPVASNTRRTARLRHDDSQVDFAPIESSPVQPTDNSQPLTDHQKEVKARQSENAQLFPDLSSSPVPSSTATRRYQLPRKLDFAEIIGLAEGDDAVTTPLELPDADGPLNDYVGSSPTPRSSEKMTPIVHDPEPLQESGLEGPPSSPPRAVDNARVIIESPERHTKEDDGEADADKDMTPKATMARTPDSDLASDTNLPAEQLQHEVDFAAGNSGVDMISGDAQSTNRSPLHITNEHDGDAAQTQHDRDDAEVQIIIDATTDVEPSKEGQDDETTEIDTSRVDNSFLEENDGDQEVATPTRPQSQSSAGGSRKRKRSSSSIYSTRRRKRASPVKQILDYAFQQRQFDATEMEDEIVVASSQVASSPAGNPQASADGDGELHDTPSKPRQAFSMDGSQDGNETAFKRPRGRRRKSVAPELEPEPEPVPAPTPVSTEKLTSTSRPRRLKRKSSALGEDKSVDDEIATTEVAQPDHVQKKSKSTRRRRGRSSKSRDENAETADSQTSINTASIDETEVSAPTKPEEELEQQIDVPQPEQAVSTPRSIISRLKDILSDCKNAILGYQELRDVDEALFAIGREAHEAARRGEGQG